MTEPFDASNHPHRRRNPLTDEWVLVSPHRNRRPWQGQTESTSPQSTSTYEPECYLCPGNTRMGGEQNPNYETTLVFPNDFPAITKDTPDHETSTPLFTSRSETGTCRVISYSPDHSKTLAELSQAQLSLVVEQWGQECRKLGESYPWVQVFENKGEVMGCSMPHPHGQIWAQSQPPTLLQKEDAQQRQYFADYCASEGTKEDRDATTRVDATSGHNLLLDYALQEQKDGTRVVVDHGDWLAVVPYWAAWPFEILLLPCFKVRRMSDLDAKQRSGLAAILKELLTRYDNLFETSFPYSMGWHGAPYAVTDDANDSNDHWQLHAHFYPPLLRSSSIRKFMVGYEMLAEPQRDLTPEQAAQILRDVSTIHYKEQTPR